ncbi:hypothetical protein SAMN05216344_110119 [Polaromonas sp. OV174]|nr:hypothetical protein SAMN05216344_110119 [Polaromonas sp. OV174]
MNEEANKDISEEVSPVPALRILKIEDCASLSGRSHLTYHLGCNEAGETHIRLYGNTGKGFYSKDWIAMRLIDALLHKGSEDKPITSGSMQALFEGKSVNTAGFILAVLKHEGLIQTTPGSLRHYERLDPMAWQADIQALVDSGVSLSELQLPAAPVVAKKGSKQTGPKAKADMKAIAKAGAAQGTQSGASTPAGPESTMPDAMDS